MTEYVCYHMAMLTHLPSGCFSYVSWRFLTLCAAAPQSLFEIFEHILFL
jgi:hypothetical protein